MFATVLPSQRRTGGIIVSGAALLPDGPDPGTGRGAETRSLGSVEGDHGINETEFFFF